MADGRWPERELSVVSCPLADRWPLVDGCWPERALSVVRSVVRSLPSAVTQSQGQAVGPDLLNLFVTGVNGFDLENNDGANGIFTPLLKKILEGTLLIGHQRSAISHRSSAIGHPPSAIGHQPSTIGIKP